MLVYFQAAVPERQPLVNQVLDGFHAINARGDRGALSMFGEQPVTLELLESQLDALDQAAPLAVITTE